jgi:hypothetical protein
VRGVILLLPLQAVPERRLHACVETRPPLASQYVRVWGGMCTCMQPATDCLGMPACLDASHVCLLPCLLAHNPLRNRARPDTPTPPGQKKKRAHRVVCKGRAPSRRGPHFVSTLGQRDIEGSLAKMSALFADEVINGYHRYAVRRLRLDVRRTQSPKCMQYSDNARSDTCNCACA